MYFSPAVLDLIDLDLLKTSDFFSSEITDDLVEFHGEGVRQR